jgi:hypothetical protein
LKDKHRIANNGPLKWILAKYTAKMWAGINQFMGTRLKFVDKVMDIWVYFQK